MSRKKTEEFILKYIDKLAPGGDNRKLYADLFKGMNNKDFDKFMVGLRDKTITLAVVVPNWGKVKIDLENNFKLGKELGYEFFQRVKFTNDKELPDYITPNKYLVYRLSIRRASQILTKKISIPEDNNSIDLSSGQVTGKSKSSKITNPETQLLAGMGFKDSVKELLKYRGGDLGAANAMNKILYKQGSVNGDMLDEYSTGVESTKTLKNYFRGMHIKSTL